jgi:hypothetical protein
MTTVVSLANMPSGSPTDVSVNFLDQSKLALRSQGFDAQSQIFTAEYIYTDGDPTIETTVSLRVAPDVKNNITRNSLRLRTSQTVTVDSIVTETAPAEVIISWNTPGPLEDVSKLMSMIGTAFGLTFNGVTSKVPNTGILSMINRSILGSAY